MKKRYIFLFLIISLNLPGNSMLKNKNQCNYKKSDYLIEKIINKMTVEEKVGQIIMPDIDHVTPKLAKKYKLGTILNGGGKFPNKNKYSTVKDWKELSKDYYNASPKIDGLIIPILWGTDAVHGHNNVIGATIFPHNIGLGAANNPDLVKKIGEAVAKEMLSTGIAWTFAPALSVPQDIRWGRTYEGFSENPELVSKLGEALIKGLQGENDFLGENHVIATAKHFVGDGGTNNGVDQGNTIISEELLNSIHAYPYYAAIDSCVQTIMASFNSWNGSKVHGNKYLLTDVLKNKMNFNGLVVGDWNGHGQLPNCTNKSCPDAFNAGVDIFMVPEYWEDLYKNTLNQVNKGIIPIERLNDAVKRILKVKYNLGLFDGKKPHLYKENYIGAQKHKQIARKAVRESIVLLKNNNSTLPIKPNQHILVVGDAAKEIKYQMGGWTISWQGRDTLNSDFPGISSIYESLSKKIQDNNGSIEFSYDGTYKIKPDIVIYVYGESPYAEGDGDRGSNFFIPEDKNLLKSMKKLSNEDIPIISLFLSGRPLIVNEEMNYSDSFVSLWLPGSAVEGISDVIFSDIKGNIENDFVGKLPYSWPLNSSSDENLFTLGYGLDYKQKTNIPILKTEDRYPQKNVINVFNGSPIPPNSEYIHFEDKWEKITSNIYNDSSVEISLSKFDYKKQDDARRIEFRKNSRNIEWGLSSGISEDISYMKNGALELVLRVNNESIEDLTFGLMCYKNSKEIKLTGSKICYQELILNNFLKDTDKWQTVLIPLSYFDNNNFELSKVTTRFFIKTKGNWALDIHTIKFLKNITGSI